MSENLFNRCFQKIGNFLKTYKVDIFIEIIVLAIIMVLYRNGFIVMKDVLSDGTFIIGAISIPLVISRYVAKKLSEKNEFYCSTLGNIIKLTSGKKEFDDNDIKARVLQLESMYTYGISKISEKDERERLSELAKNVYFQLITKNINLEKINSNNLNESKDYVKNINFDLIDKFEEDDEKNGWLRKLRKNLNKSEEETIDDEEWFSKEIQVVLPNLCWKQEVECPSEPEQSGSDSDNNFIIYYKCNLVFSSTDDMIQTFLSNSILLESIFNFKTQKVKEKLVEDLSENKDNNDENILLIKPQFIVDDDSDNEPKTLNLDFTKVYADVITNISTKSDLDKLYAGKNVLKKRSRSYSEENEYTLKSWFSVTLKKLNALKDEDIDSIIFTIQNENNDHFPPFTVLEFKKDDFIKLTDRKLSYQKLSKLNFYFWVDFNKEKQVVKVYDARDKDNYIDIGIKSINEK